MLLAAILAVAIPLIFLYLVRWLDLYASGSFKLVLVCLLWGVVAFAAAFLVNNLAKPIVGAALVVTVTAPIAEEILKSLALVYLVRRSDFTYFVDGAIYGFAAGSAFAVLEGLDYMLHAGAGGALVAVLSRAFSTTLMHGSASALVGVSLGRLRFGRGLSRLASVPLGWVAAIALHATYNNMVNNLAKGESGLLMLGLAIALGLAGLGLIVAFILWGLSEERRWLRETLGLNVGVSAGEAAVVQKMADLESLLAPIGERFGEGKRRQVEDFLRLQAQMGLKRKAQEMTEDAGRRRELEEQVAALREEMDVLRRSVGVYCMSYVRSILPPETEPLWSRLGQNLETVKTPAGPSLWGTLGNRMGAGGQGSEDGGQESGVGG
ncbi:MAG: PrsW family intramembrane metalloprotease [Chloroflexi bacterium]|nr:PrsW family intramembrane metalloprotease [Chloroflexota bacterium]